MNKMAAAALRAARNHIRPRYMKSSFTAKMGIASPNPQVPLRVWLDWSPLAATHKGQQ